MCFMLGWNIFNHLSNDEAIINYRLSKEEIDCLILLLVRLSTVVSIYICKHKSCNEWIKIYNIYIYNCKFIVCL